MSSKGKGKAKEVSSGKRKTSGGAGESHRKRKKPGVLQFFEEAAEVDDNESSDDSDWENNFMDKEPDLNVNKQTGKNYNLPFVLKEEVIEEEFDKMMEERYKDGAGFVTYAEDSYEDKESIDKNSDVPSSKDPTIWKVKCVVGRERHSAFCLMQKFIDLKSLGNKLQIISAFSVDHIKGFFYIEAEKQCDINEACKGLTYIYWSRVMPVPSNEVYQLLSVRTKRTEITEGTWARIKNGNYKGDLCQVVAVNNERKRATVKLIPRIDLQAMAAKFGGGVSLKKTVIPAPKLISSSELEEFQPLIQIRRDRDTGLYFQVLDGMMLKDGYLYKRVSVDSINCWGVMPTDEELLKFSHSDNNESGDMEWLAQLYGEQKRKKTVKTDKGGGKGGGEKGEGSSGSGMENGFELHDLVCFGRKDFGLIVGMEKDDSYKILKEAPEGPVVVTVEQRELKSGPLDTKFTALDQHSKTISINDTVKVLEGQHEGKQGIVKQIYRGTIFLYDENETDNGGFFCCKSQNCEKIKQFFDVCKDKGGEPDTSGFEDFTSSPKSPLSPEKSQQERGTRSDFNRGNREGMFSIGQTLRIRVGPLKGYLCRVLAVHYSDVTVKLDSKQKVLTVKNEHLAEVQGKSYAANTSEHDGSSSFKPFDLGAEGSSGDWLDRSGASADGGGWNAERSSWPSFSAGTSNQVEANNSNACGAWDTVKKDGADTAWGCKSTSNQNSSWGAAVSSGDNDKKTDGATTSWETKVTTNQNSAWATGGSDQAGAWGKAIPSTEDPSGASEDVGGSWGQAKLKIGNPAESWDKGKNVTETSSGAWGDAAAKENQVSLWGKDKAVVEDGLLETKENKDVSEGHWGSNALGSNQQDSWGKKKDASGSEGNSWGKAAEKWGNNNGSGGSKGGWGSAASVPENATGGWGNAGGCSSKPEAGNNDESSGWKKANDFRENQTTNWNNNNTEGGAGLTRGGSWNQSDGGISWGKGDGGSSWSKGGGSSGGEQSLGNAGNDSKGWKNQNDGWNKPKSSGSDQGPSGWNKQKMESEDGTAPKDSNWNSGPGDASQDSGWGKKSNWNSGSANQDPGWVILVVQAMIQGVARKAIGNQELEMQARVQIGVRKAIGTQEVQTRIKVGPRKIIQTLDLMMQQKVLVGERKMTLIQELQMQIRIQTGAQKVAGVLEPVILAKTLGVKRGIGTLVLVVQARIQVGARKATGTRDLEMQARVQVGARKAIGTREVEMKTKVRLLVIGEIGGEALVVETGEVFVGEVGVRIIVGSYPIHLLGPNLQAGTSQLATMILKKVRTKDRALVEVGVAKADRALVEVGVAKADRAPVEVGVAKTLAGIEEQAPETKMEKLGIIKIHGESQHQVLGDRGVVVARVDGNL
ncbi:hypothetical protein COLO4_09867 [Corchorus olitorius]|uniref:KOW domain-containing protein n=1 Tax=Corchorus olitorius TaxID=93759 RepID=A0A1R3KAS3_9ROSI|nr:hypothetical protein COLO4_09867 [Corchorus olitorius]